MKRAILSVVLMLVASAAAPQDVAQSLESKVQAVVAADLAQQIPLVP
jgi:hypothetical protein